MAFAVCMRQYNPPEVTEYGAVDEITEDGGDDKSGSGTDEFSSVTPLTGSTY